MTITSPATQGGCVRGRVGGDRQTRLVGSLTTSCSSWESSSASCPSGMNTSLVFGVSCFALLSHREGLRPAWSQRLTNPVHPTTPTAPLHTTHAHALIIPNHPTPTGHMLVQLPRPGPTAGTTPGQVHTLRLRLCQGEKALRGCVGRECCACHYRLWLSGVQRLV